MREPEICEMEVTVTFLRSGRIPHQEAKARCTKREVDGMKSLHGNDGYILL